MKVFNKIKEVCSDSRFWLIAFISIAFFGIFLKMDYATDTYSVFQTPIKDMLYHFFSSGRLITGLAYGAVMFLRLGEKTIYLLSFVAAIVATTIAIYKLYCIFQKDIKSTTLAVVASVLILLNVFSIELYLFIEKGILMLSILFSVLAFEQIIRYLEGNKKSIIGALVYMLLANFSYQGTVAIFVALSLLYIVKHTKDVKTFLKYNIVTALCYGIPALINFVIVRFAFANARVSGGIDWIVSIQKVLEGTVNILINSYSIIPRYLFVIVFLSLVGVLIYLVCRDKKGAKKNGLLILGALYVTIGTVVVTMFPQLLQGTNSIWFVARSTYAFASLIGILFAYIAMNFEINKQLEKVVSVLLIVYLGFQFIGFQNVERDHYIMNYLDQYTCMQIEEQVKNYEQQSDQKITKVAFYFESNRSYGYPDLYVNGDTNIKSMFPEWSQLDSLNYYLNRDLEKTQRNEDIYTQHFKDKKWRFFDKEQLVFSEDTVHVFIY